MFRRNNKKPKTKPKSKESRIRPWDRPKVKRVDDLKIDTKTEYNTELLQSPSRNKKLDLAHKPNSIGRPASNISPRKNPKSESLKKLETKSKSKPNLISSTLKYILDEIKNKLAYNQRYLVTFALFALNVYVLNINFIESAFKSKLEIPLKNDLTVDIDPQMSTEVNLEGEQSNSLNPNTLTQRSGRPKTRTITFRKKTIQLSDSLNVNKFKCMEQNQSESRANKKKKDTFFIE